jgi:hypothetical protein
MGGVRMGLKRKPVGNAQVQRPIGVALVVSLHVVERHQVPPLPVVGSVHRDQRISSRTARHKQRRAARQHAAIDQALRARVRRLRSGVVQAPVNTRHRVPLQRAMRELPLQLLHALAVSIPLGCCHL